MYKLAWKVDNTELDALVATATVENETEALEATDWIEWKTPATDAEKTKTIVASIELPAGAGDEYQDKAAKVSFTVEAVQANAVVEKVSTFDQLTSAITVGVEDIALVDDIEIPLETQLVIPEGATLNLDLSGHQIVGGSYNAPSNDEGYMIVNKGTLNISGDENSLISATNLKSITAICWILSSPFRRANFSCSSAASANAPVRLPSIWRWICLTKR